jgi:hypothetical protein
MADAVVSQASSCKPFESCCSYAAAAAVTENFFLHHMSHVAMLMVVDNQTG